MIRFRSTHDDHLTSVSPRTTRYLATIEAARARHPVCQADVRHPL